MSRFDELKTIRDLSERGDTNSIVQLVQDSNTEELYARKTIYGIEHPLYQGIFLREVQALYKLNNCDNIVKIINHRNMVVSNEKNKTREKVGCIFLEYISGETLSKTNISRLTSKHKFKIIKQLLNAIETAHYNGIIHRDINPNNIMLDDNGDVKVIDFGICKIKQMINSATVFRMGTNAYSAPEVHAHSHSATVKSDLYSIGAVIYYLFTGDQPPMANCFQCAIDKASGFDVDLKPIIKKLVAENPSERYNDISDLKNDLSGLFERFLETNYTIVLTLDYEKFKKLKNLNLIPRSLEISNLKTILPVNFMDLYIKQEGEKYLFLGTNYCLDCCYNATTNIFDVVDVKKIIPRDREILKKRFCEICAKLDVVDSRIIHKLSKNDNLEVKNIVDAFCEEYRSKYNVDAEYKSKFGAWRKLLILTKESIEKSVQRYAYDSYTIDGNVCIFNLCPGVFLGDVVYTKESKFVFEKKNKREDKKILVYIGNYDEDSLTDEHVVLKIRFLRKPNGLPAKGTICLDYSESITNINRQLDALDNIEREDYFCPYNLKEIIAGVTSPKTNSLHGRVKYLNPKLDLPQRTAVEKALNAESLSIIQGPPGTGKTNVVIEIIRQILKMNTDYPDLPEKKILLVSQSHPAVDKMLDDLIQQSNIKPNLVRVGRDEKLNDEIREEFGLNYVKDNWVAHVRDCCSASTESFCKEIGVTVDEFDEYYREYEKQFISNMAVLICDEVAHIKLVPEVGLYSKVFATIPIIGNENISEKMFMYSYFEPGVYFEASIGAKLNLLVKEFDFEKKLIEKEFPIEKWTLGNKEIPIGLVVNGTTVHAINNKAKLPEIFLEYYDVEKDANCVKSLSYNKLKFVSNDGITLNVEDGELILPSATSSGSCYVTATYLHTDDKTYNAVFRVLISGSMIEGKVSAYKANHETVALEDAEVSLYSTNNRNVAIGKQNTDENGKFAFNVSKGEYQMVISADGYLTLKTTQKVEEDEIKYAEHILLIDNEQTGNGSASGTLTDAINGQGISGAKLKLRTDWNNKTGPYVEGVEFETNSAGHYTIANIPVGYYTLEASLHGYVTGYTNIIVLSSNPKTDFDFTISPLLADDEIRIVLTWGETPSDLDSHLIGRKPNDDVFNVYYQSKHCYYENIEMANLDVDDTTSYGPETITILENIHEAYTYAVHDYSHRNSSNSSALSMSGAVVRVFVGSEQIGEYHVPTDQVGTYWTVFQISGSGRVLPINSVSNIKPSA